MKKKFDLTSLHSKPKDLCVGNKKYVFSFRYYIYNMKCAAKYAYAYNILYYITLYTYNRQSHGAAGKRTLVACVWDSEMAHYNIIIRHIVLTLYL